MTNFEMGDRDKFVIKEIEIIQNTITRMASNSFLIKGWALTVITGIILFELKTSHYYYVAIIPLVFFWYLDAYFLRTERLYRKLYEWVIQNRFKTDDYFLDMDSNRFYKNVPSTIRTMFDHYLLTFYGSILLIILVMITVKCFQKIGG